METRVREMYPRELYNAAQRSWYTQENQLSGTEVMNAAMGIGVSWIVTDEVITRLSARELYRVGGVLYDERGFSGVSVESFVLEHRDLVRRLVVEALGGYEAESIFCE